MTSSRPFLSIGSERVSQLCNMDVEYTQLIRFISLARKIMEKNWLKQSFRCQLVQARKIFLGLTSFKKFAWATLKALEGRTLDTPVLQQTKCFSIKL